MWVWAHISIPLGNGQKDFLCVGDWTGESTVGNTESIWGKVHQYLL